MEVLVKGIVHYSNIHTASPKSENITAYWGKEAGTEYKTSQKKMNYTFM